MEDLREVMQEIRACDTDKPYIFVSYSSNDKELVWRDVLEFQKRGYNVWLDEKNLDKTKDSWKEDALKGIQDRCCRLVVFYVSKHSLCSEACYSELKQTQHEKTIARHNGEVNFVAIDAEDVGNIGAFMNTVFDYIENSEISKEEKDRKSDVLFEFRNNYFNSNNERVRVRPKEDENRALDYYEEIMESFPADTRIYDDQKAKAPADTAKEKNETPEPARSAAERAPLEEATPAEEKNTQTEDTKALVKDAPPDMEPDKKTREGNEGYGSLYEALKATGGHVPSVTDKQGASVHDTVLIELLEKRYIDNEEILYADNIVRIKLVKKEDIHRKKSGFITNETFYLMLVVTSRRLMAISEMFPDELVFVEKTDVKSVSGVYVPCTFLSVKYSQIQVETKDEDCVIINKFFMSEKEYRLFLERITALLTAGR